MTVMGRPDLWPDRPSWGSPEGIAMLSEITASYRDTDRVDKRRAYAAAGIPLYLLVDRENRETVLFSRPDVEAQDYRADVRVPFGSDLELPPPFSFTLTDFTPHAE
jgi:Uma2 family endonuclease